MSTNPKNDFLIHGIRSWRTRSVAERWWRASNHTDGQRTPSVTYLSVQGTDVLSSYGCATPANLGGVSARERNRIPYRYAENTPSSQSTGGAQPRNEPLWAYRSFPSETKRAFAGRMYEGRRSPACHCPSRTKVRASAATNNRDHALADAPNTMSVKPVLRRDYLVYRCQERSSEQAERLTVLIGRYAALSVVSRRTELNRDERLSFGA